MFSLFHTMRRNKKGKTAKRIWNKKYEKTSLDRMLVWRWTNIFGARAKNNNNKKRETRKG